MRPNSFFLSFFFVRNLLKPTNEKLVSCSLLLSPSLFFRNLLCEVAVENNFSGSETTKYSTRKIKLGQCTLRNHIFHHLLHILGIPIHSEMLSPSVGSKIYSNRIPTVLYNLYDATNTI